jgi:DNA (cytosine-5)-methyltransferase 1
MMVAGTGVAVYKPRKNTKRPEYDLAPLRADRLDLPPLLDAEHRVIWSDETDEDLTILDLFSGAGGMSLGFESAGFKPLLGVDLDQWACRTFEANIPARAVQQNLEQIHDFRAFLAAYGVTHVTGIIGGPPCQGFSRVGRGRIRHRDRLNGHSEPVVDARNRLYRQFIAAVDSLKPAFFVMENVPDLDTYEDPECPGMRLADRIEAEFEDLGYQVSRQILLAANFGVPQLRSRLFFVGFHRSRGGEFDWPDQMSARGQYGVQTLRNAIGDLPPVSDNQLSRELPYGSAPNDWLHRWYRWGVPQEQAHLVFDHITRPHREDDKQDFRSLDEGQRFADIPEERRRYRCDIFRDKYRKLIWNEPSWTLTAHIRRDSYRYIHPDREPPRTISVREAARIQSFPDRWRFCGYRSNAFSQIGNAVPPLLSRALARAIRAQILGLEVSCDPFLQVGTRASATQRSDGAVQLHALLEQSVTAY